MRLAAAILFASAFATPVLAQQVAAPGLAPSYVPITSEQRLKWFAASTVGPPSLAAGTVISGWNTGFDNPPEYSTNWDGFGKRFGIRMSGISTANAIEASLGAAWGEDPRYIRIPGQPFRTRLWQIVRMTFLATYPDGSTRPAYARHTALVSSNVLSNAWRVESQTSFDDVVVRCIVGAAGRMAGNAFAEFWPDVAEGLFRRKKKGQSTVQDSTQAERP